MIIDASSEDRLKQVLFAAVGLALAACAQPKPTQPTFLAGKIVSTEVAFVDSPEIIASGLNDDYARAQGLKRLRAPGRGGEESDEFAEANAEFDRVARSPEAAKWSKDQILEAVTDGVEAAAPSLSRSEPDAVLKFEIVAVGVNMPPLSSSKFRRSAIAIQHGLIAKVSLLDPSSRVALWGPATIESTIGTRQQVPAKQILGALRTRLTRNLLEEAASCPEAAADPTAVCYVE